MKKRKNGLKRLEHKLKSSFKGLSAVKKEVALLREWSERNAEVEFLLPLAGGSIKYSGRIVDTTIGDGKIANFHFVSSSGVQAILMPQTFGKSSVERIEHIHNGVYVEGKKDGRAFSIVESLFEKKPNANLATIIEKLRTWERLQSDLHVLVNRGGHAISFLGQARELTSGIFSFTRPPAPAQLMIRLEEYKHMSVKADGDKSSVVLIDPRTEEMCVISDAATQPETLFQRFSDVSSMIH